VSGCGTINGTVVIDAGGTLTFTDSGGATNAGTLLSDRCHGAMK